MQIRPQDEDGIISMILRDTREILKNKQYRNIFEASRVKYQKVIFIVAEELDIPLTRSWYLFGGYVYNAKVDFDRLNDLDSLSPPSYTLDGEVLGSKEYYQIKNAEKLFSPVQSRYSDLLNHIVPQIFFSKLHTFLRTFYERAPEEYQPLYYNNLKIESNFEIVGKPQITNQTELLKFIPNKNMFKHYKDFTKCLSRLILEISDSPDFSYTYDYASRYIDLLEDFLVKADSENDLPINYFKLFKISYQKAIWKPIALKIALKTLKGVYADKIKVEHEEQVATSNVWINRNLDLLTDSIIKGKMFPSVDERSQFFKTVYGNDKEILGALSNVWKSYKG